MSKMKKDMQLEKLANDIADAIVELVERTDGPVTLARVDREVPGFAKKEPPTFQYATQTDDGETIIWDGMTEAGAAALRMVMRGHRVAVQPMDVRPYLAEGYLLKNENWLPVVLLPAGAGNLEAQHWLIRVPQKFRDYCVAEVKART